MLNISAEEEEAVEACDVAASCYGSGYIKTCGFGAGSAILLLKFPQCKTGLMGGIHLFTQLYKKKLV
jgi:hypothetical protein